MSRILEHTDKAGLAAVSDTILTAPTLHTQDFSERRGSSTGSAKPIGVDQANVQAGQKVTWGVSI